MALWLEFFFGSKRSNSLSTLGVLSLDCIARHPGKVPFMYKNQSQPSYFWTCYIYNIWSVSWNAVLRGPQSLSESCDLWMPLVYIMKLCVYIYMVYMKLNSNCCHNGEWPFWARTRSEACTILQTLGWLLDSKHVCWLVEGCVGPTGPNMSQSFSCHKTFRRVAEVGSLWHCRLTPLTLSLWDC